MKKTQNTLIILITLFVILGCSQDSTQVEWKKVDSGTEAASLRNSFWRC